MTLIIGLTGGIASGKSTVSTMFSDLNIPVIDADQLARDVVQPGKKAYEKIVSHFGREIVQQDQTLDRQKLGSIVFANDEKRQELNHIIHPAIRKQMVKQRDDYVRSKEPCVVLDIPLLFESQLMHYVHKIIVVYVDEDVQLKRLIKRDGFTQEEASQRIQSQLPLKEKAQKADAIIDNNGTIEQSATQLKQILSRWHVNV